MPKGKAVSKFQPSHDTEYGLKISSRHPSSGAVSTVMCRFCATFGREEKVGGKRARTRNVKYFKTFRTDGYRRHLSTVHAERWAEYKLLQSKEEKEQFFSEVSEDPVPSVNTLDEHLDEQQKHIRVLINGPIVETVVGDLLLHSHVETVSRARALQQFKKLEEPELPNEEGGLRDLYEVVVKTPRRFNLFTNFVACGASFTMASRLMECTKAESGNSVYGGCTDVVASNYTRFVCAHALQILSDVLEKMWAFSIALDSSTHQGMSYMDVRVRFTYQGRMFNFHMVAVPLFERHTDKSMFLVLERFLDAVLPSWRERCIAVSTDGARNMTGRVKGLVTRIQKVCVGGLIRIWCGLHMLDLEMQNVFKSALEEEFYETLTALIGHLRRQANLIAEMRTTCPKVSDGRWISLHSVSAWLVKNRARVIRHLDEKKPACTPSVAWWIFLHAIDSFARESMGAFVSLQGLTTIVSEQHARLEQLVDTYCRMSGMQGPLSRDQIDDIVAVQSAETSGLFIVTHESVRSSLDGLGLWVMEELDRLDADRLRTLLSSIGKLLVQAANGISQILCERGESNEAVPELPPVLPHELCRIDMRQFVKVLHTHRERLLPSFGSDGIDDISKEFSGFLRAFREDPEFKKAVLSNVSGLVGFAEGWASTQGRFPMLQRFCGGLASAFPHTATVESDFSVIGWEKDDSRLNITDLSIEGILHCKQYKELKKLSNDLWRASGGA